MDIHQNQEISLGTLNVLCAPTAPLPSICQHHHVGRIRFVAVTGIAAAASIAPVCVAPSVHAEPCPDAEVVFARGTTELPGLGPTGDAFVESLRTQVGAKSVGVYAVEYPATIDFSTAVVGIADAHQHVLATAAACPDTKMVLGGFSQGAAVAGFVTANVVPDGVAATDVPAPMPPEVADHIVAVALFGKPSPRFMRVINDPTIVIGPQYAGKTIDLCVDNDLVCDPDGSSFAVHNQYAETGMVTQGAAFVANQLNASWAADALTTPGAETATTQAPAVPAPSPLSAEAPGQAPSEPEHLPASPGPLPGPAVPGADGAA